MIQWQSNFRDLQSATQLSESECSMPAAFGFEKVFLFNVNAGKGKLPKMSS
jgi:hypothetical protein